ncbi:MAG: 2,3-bisphosphoglycerate-independent phosphoglycerate mutase [Sphingobacteriales bacterium]|nr:MAG: 2,3-bisphosphoglycerate-independent phosphoglycerate mutase [Sphingobacteriales bacterium]
MSRKAILLIMDGWGIGAIPAADAIAHARTPFVSSLYGKYAHTELLACGEAVGLPEGQMGNSEVGHLNLGAGRVVYQELQRINVAVRDGELAQNLVLQAAFTKAVTSGKAVHFIGLVSDGGVHSHTRHLEALLQAAQAAGVEKSFVHAFTDGRDTDPKSGLGYLQALQPTLKATGAQLATVIGRYWAMDRDNRWDRVHTAYSALVHGEGEFTESPLAIIEKRYACGETDEFLKPIIITDAAHKPLALIQEDDVVICFNFRTDRCREITQVLTQKGIPEYGMKPLNLHYVTMTEYDKSFRNVGVIFQTDNLTHTLGEVLEGAGKKQIRIAETEKYPHVTFFFSGGRETPFEGESRILIPSPKDVPTYDLKPEMSALEITAAILPEIEAERPDFICLNFANADMVGHTGVWGAAIRAAETVDRCVARIVPLALAHGYEIFLTADHGNSDFMVNPDGSPNTAHSLNPVPLFLITNEAIPSIKAGKLGDIAPTILARLGVTIPAQMTGEVLVDA